MRKSLDDDERAELQAYRDGLGQLAYDPPAPGRPVEVGHRYVDAEPIYYQQVHHNGQPVWHCAECTKLTVGSAPRRCAGCGLGAEDNLSTVLTEALSCRSWFSASGPLYDGPCLIAGSDGCECTEVAA